MYYINKEFHEHCRKLGRGVFAYIEMKLDGTHLHVESTNGEVHDRDRSYEMELKIYGLKVEAYDEITGKGVTLDNGSTKYDIDLSSYITDINNTWRIKADCREIEVSQTDCEEYTLSVNTRVSFNESTVFVRPNWTPPNINYKVDGQIKSYDKACCRINGQLKDIDKIWTKTNGILKEV